MPQSSRLYLNALIGKPLAQLRQGQVWLKLEPVHQGRLRICHPRPSIAANLVARSLTINSQSLAHLVDPHTTDLVPLGNVRGTIATLNRSQHAIT
jgi:hypothetical protein